MEGSNPLFTMSHRELLEVALEQEALLDRVKESVQHLGYTSLEDLIKHAEAAKRGNETRKHLTHKHT